ncbi:TPA: sel1 repeat family protein [Legionella pneumophila]|nr:sel1 repeat family protein [Legionella pneumophila]HBD7304447.1 sel1 repeat family protein [Legionella pneumophila]
MIKKLLLGLIYLLSLENYASDVKRVELDEFESIGGSFHHIDNEYYKKLKICSNKGNKYCSFALGQHYFLDGNYSKAYHLFVKSDGIIVKWKGNESESSSDWYIGHMHDEGIGVLQNRDKAIQYYKKCAILGLADCGLGISIAYLNTNNIVQSYAWAQVTRALVHQRDREIKSVLDDTIKYNEEVLGTMKIKEANVIARKICSSIPKCIQ